jgi:hypothetical protein
LEVVHVAKQDEVVLPDVREGQVWEDCSSHEEVVAERKLRVCSVPAEPDAQSHVTVRNMVTGVESEIRLDRFVPGSGGFRRLV